MTALGLMYVYAYANYGIIMRTRIMATPFLYMFILQVLTAEKSKAPAGKVS